MVFISPERRNAIIKNVKKNISAVPKSFIRNRQPIQESANTRYFVRLLVDCRYSSVAAPTKTKPIFTISDGCIETPPILIQLYAPFILCAKSLVATSTITEAIATGIRSFTTLSISLSTQSITINTAIPIITAAS